MVLHRNELLRSPTMLNRQPTVFAASFQRLGFEEECATYIIIVEAVGALGSELVDVDRPRSFASENSCHRRQLPDATTGLGTCQIK